MDPDLAATAKSARVFIVNYPQDHKCKHDGDEQTNQHETPTVKQQHVEGKGFLYPLEFFSCRPPTFRITI